MFYILYTWYILDARYSIQELLINLAGDTDPEDDEAQNAQITIQAFKDMQVGMEQLLESRLQSTAHSIHGNIGRFRPGVMEAWSSPKYFVLC